MGEPGVPDPGCPLASCETIAFPQWPVQDSPPSSVACDSAHAYCERALSYARSCGAKLRCTQRQKRQDLPLATVWGGVRKRKSSGRVGLARNGDDGQVPAGGRMAEYLLGVVCRCLFSVHGTFQRASWIGEPGAQRGSWTGALQWETAVVAPCLNRGHGRAHPQSCDRGGREAWGCDHGVGGKPGSWSFVCYFKEFGI